MFKFMCTCINLYTLAHTYVEIFDTKKALYEKFISNMLGIMVVISNIVITRIIVNKNVRKLCNL